MRGIALILMMGLLASCQSFAGEDVSATLSYDMTAFVTESAMIQTTAIVEQTEVVATLQTVGTVVAESSNVNMILAATLQSNIVPTPAIRSVVVNPDDMGSSLDTEIMDDGEFADTEPVVGNLSVDNAGTANSVRSSDGCSNGNASQFPADEDQIYFTARVNNLQTGINFSVDWVFEERLVYRSSWTSDYSAQSECIWFYMTPDDAPFLPGVYSVTLFIDGQSISTQSFSINTG